MNVTLNVIPEISNLYQWIEIDFEPLKLCDKVNNVLNVIKDLDDYQQYVKPLMEVTATRMLRQVRMTKNQFLSGRICCIV